MIIRPAIVIGVGVALGAAATLVSCAGSGSEKVETRVVALGEFAGGEPTIQPADAADDATDAEGDVEDFPGILALPEPEMSAPAEGGIDPTYTVDSLVGQVNGRPIFASEFFDPIEDQLIAERIKLQEEKLTVNDYIRTVDKIISDRLREVVTNELFIAEAVASLSQQEQQALSLWELRFWESERSRHKGSESELERALAEQEGLTWDEYLEQRKNEALAMKLLREKVAPRVNVSWRDIEREYERRKDEFNTPAMATLMRIRLSTRRQADEITDVNDRLAAGEDFVEIARSVRRSFAQPWLEDIKLGPEGLAGAEIGVESADFKAAVASLREGETTAPIVVGPHTWWVHLAEYTEAKNQSIYDVQRSLEEQIYSRRVFEEQERYRRTLFAKGVYDDFELMQRRLREIAFSRYIR